MKKYLLIDAIRTNKEPCNDGSSWLQYTIHPVANALAFMKSAADEYNEKLPKKWYVSKIRCTVVGVRSQERACIEIVGTKKRVLDFIQQCVMQEGFNNFWAWREVDIPSCYL